MYILRIDNKKNSIFYEVEVDYTNNPFSKFYGKFYILKNFFIKNDIIEKNATYINNNRVVFYNKNYKIREFNTLDEIATFLIYRKKERLFIKLLFNNNKKEKI